MIRSEGLSELSKGVTENTGIKVIDLSFNSLGSIHMQKGTIGLSNALGDTITEFSNALRANKALVHLDLSFWGFTAEDWDILNLGLVDNHTILGIHMLGNRCGVDALGYLSEKIVPPIMSHLYSRMDPFLKVGEISQKDFDLERCKNCWICEAWVPFTFEYEKKMSSVAYIPFDSDTDVLLHLSIDSYYPDLMIKNEESSFKYTKTRMVPPGNIKFFFSVKGVSQYMKEFATIQSSPDDTQDCGELH